MNRPSFDPEDCFHDETFPVDIILIDYLISFDLYKRESKAIKDYFVIIHLKTLLIELH